MKILFQAVLASTFMFASVALVHLHAADKPNFVYIMLDDLGWNDAGFRGGALHTPNLDKLAAGGALLNAFYSQPYSTAARAALLTGRYPMRYGLQTLSILPGSGFGLPADERTLAAALKETGYTTAFIGKWQLGHAKPEFRPLQRGFDYFYGTLSGDVGPVLKKTPNIDWWRNDRMLEEEGFVSALLARDAGAVIRSHDVAAPLFLMLSFAAPAAPAAASKEFLDRYANIADQPRRTYAAVVSAVDDAIGQVVQALEARAMSSNTLLVVQSDNGGAVPLRFATGDGDVASRAADNGIFREGKGSLYEGGVRVFALASFPGRIKPGTIVTDLLHVTDMYATLLQLAGAKSEQAKKPDGFPVWQTIGSGEPSPRKEILLNVDDFGGALRVGEWKLVVRAAMPSRLELFDIANDPEEAENKAETYPDRARQLLTRLNAYAYDMAPAKYLEELSKAHSVDIPIYWGSNPARR
jgi:arylsulfatase A-like enzyme